MAAKKEIVCNSYQEELEQFAKRFSKDDWNILCEYQIFLDTLSKDVQSCRILAEHILAGKIKDKKSKVAK